ncbi:MAG: hypothetical protein EXS37_15120 [Opitutus sp.]|nr:hypothetical protein [Opitutus sp.]
MPILRRDGKTGAVALTKDKDRILAYTLTPAALRRLRDHGVRIGGALPSSVLAALIRAGDAHSPRPADAAGQGQLFGDDDTADHLPRCETTGTTADLHLVVHAATGAVVAQLLSSDARFVLRKSTSLSLPIWLLSTRLLDQLEASGTIPRSADATGRLREWFRRDHEDVWIKLAKSSTQQSALDLGSSSDELPLPG